VAGSVRSASPMSNFMQFFMAGFVAPLLLLEESSLSCCSTPTLALMG
jgi:hypothetical protein